MKEDAKEQPWIPSSERLPEDGQEVQISWHPTPASGNDGFPEYSVFRDEKFALGRFNQPTHWRPKAQQVEKTDAPKPEAKMSPGEAARKAWGERDLGDYTSTSWNNVAQAAITAFLASTDGPSDEEMDVAAFGSASFMSETWKNRVRALFAPHIAKAQAEVERANAETLRVMEAWMKTTEDRDMAQAEAQKWKARATFHEKAGITLLDAKWLDPACHKGCQSLVLKAELDRQKALISAINKSDNANAFLAREAIDTVTQIQNSFPEGHPCRHDETGVSAIKAVSDVLKERDRLKGELAEYEADYLEVRQKNAELEYQIGKAVAELAALKADYEAAQEGLRGCCLLCGFDPSDGEGTSPDDVVKAVKTQMDYLSDQWGKADGELQALKAAPEGWPTQTECFQIYEQGEKEPDCQPMRFLLNRLTQYHNAIVNVLNEEITKLNGDIAAMVAESDSERIQSLIESCASAQAMNLRLIEKMAFLTKDNETLMKSQIAIGDSKLVLENKFGELITVLEKVQEILYWLSSFQRANGYRVNYQIELYNEIVRLTGVTRPSSLVDSIPPP